MKENNQGTEGMSLDECRAHYGNEPHLFWVAFRPDQEPELLNVDQVWAAARQGRKASFFASAPLDATERKVLKFRALQAGGAP